MIPGPVHCRAESYHLLEAQLAHIGSTRGLVRSAVAIAKHEHGNADHASVERQIAELAEKIANRVHDHNDPRSILAHAHQVLFDEEGFIGDTDDYYAVENSYLPAVLERRRGLPIVLVLLYKAVLDPLGVQVRGVNAPGHFLASVRTPPDKPMLIDPFQSGRVLTTEEAFVRIAAISGRPLSRKPDLLAPASHREWLIRMLRNLRALFARLGRTNDQSAMLEMQNLLGG